MIPGSNILSIALKSITPSTVSYFKFLSRSLNDVGDYVSIFNSPVDIRGSWQPVSRNVYQAQGLDFQKSYFNFYVRNDIFDIGRDVSGDELEINNRRYKCESITPWFSLDGWSAVLCVDIGAASGYNLGFGNFGVFA